MFDTDPDKLNYRNMYCYIQYAEASYKQMAVLQKMNEAVKNRQTGSADRLGTVFDQTLRLQQQAIAVGLVLETPAVQTVENMAVDSLRFYLSFVPYIVLAAILTALGVGTAAAGIISIVRSPSVSPLKTEAIISLTVEEEKTRRKAYKKHSRSELIAAALGIALALTVIIVPSLKPAQSKENADISTRDRIHSVYNSDGAVLSLWLSECQTDPEKALSESGSMLDLIDNVGDELDIIVQSSDAGDDAARISKDLSRSLDIVKGYLENGSLPDKTTCKRTAGYIVEGMKVDSESLITEAFESLEDLF